MFTQPPHAPIRAIALARRASAAVIASVLLVCFPGAAMAGLAELLRQTSVEAEAQGTWLRLAYGHYGDAIDSLSPFQRSALVAYISNGSEINYWIRNGTLPPNSNLDEASVQTILGDMEEAFGKLRPLQNDDLTLFRSASTQGLEVEQLNVGDIVGDNAYVSTSIDRRFAESWLPDGDTMYVIQGSENAFSLQGLQSGRDNFEVVFNRGSRFRVVETLRENNRTYYLLSAENNMPRLGPARDMLTGRPLEEPAASGACP